MTRPTTSKKLTSKVPSKSKVSVKLKSAKKPKAKILEVGAPVPAFSMPVTGGGEVSSVSLKGKPYVLYFYPKDKTSGCTAEACGFQEALSQFKKLGVTIIGVSKDTIKSHDLFAKQYNLDFPLASDADTQVAETFGVWVQKSMYGRSYMGMDRSTFLVDGKGVIRSIWRKVSVPGHVEDVRKAIKDM